MAQPAALIDTARHASPAPIDSFTPTASVPGSPALLPPAGSSLSSAHSTTFSATPGGTPASASTDRTAAAVAGPALATVATAAQSVTDAKLETQRTDQVARQQTETHGISHSLSTLPLRGQDNATITSLQTDPRFAPTHHHAYPHAQRQDLDDEKTEQRIPSRHQLSGAAHNLGGLKKDARTGESKPLTIKASDSVAARLQGAIALPGPLKDVFKVPLSLGPVIGSSLDADGKAWMKAMKYGKNTASFLELPGKAFTMIDRFQTADGTIQDSVEVGLSVVDLVPSVVDGVEIAYDAGLINIESIAMGIIGAVGSLASMMGAGYYAGKEIWKLVVNLTDEKGVNWTKVGENLLKIAKYVGYTALATIGFLSFIFGFLIAPLWVITALASVACVAALTVFFYEKILDPNDKYGPKVVGELPATEEVNEAIQERMLEDKQRAQQRMAHAAASGAGSRVQANG